MLQACLLAHPFDILLALLLSSPTLVTLLLDMSKKSTKEHAHWTTEDEKVLLLFLIDHKAEGDLGSFKKATWNSAAININEQIFQGGLKTGDACKGKFQVVSPFLNLF